jgi:hypothetical protein
MGRLIESADVCMQQHFFFLVYSSTPYDHYSIPMLTTLHTCDTSLSAQSSFNGPLGRPGAQSNVETVVGGSFLYSS